MMRLPIDDSLGEVIANLRSYNQLVLQAPPGAGKTTKVPLAILDAGLFAGKIVMLEPRRLATRAAAQRLADQLNEPVGQRVGYRMRGEGKSSTQTRIEVVTEGVLTRMIQSDPELTGIDCIIFDEFHERSLQADFGLALCLEIRDALRPDLCLIAMSATLDAEPVAQLIGNAPIVTSQGRSFPVTTHFLDRPWSKPGQKGPRFETAMTDLICHAADQTQGSLLAFLPGEGEIRRVEGLLANRLNTDIDIRPLFGAMPFAQQRLAIAPSKTRKLVLATSIAETSLTIDGISVVVDGGRARRAVFDAGSGMSRLITDRVTKAEATQRAGRAGRLQAGACYKLWTKGEDGGMQPYSLPEILSSDLTPLVLELANWGTDDPKSLAFLTPPREADFQAAQSLLVDLGALDSDHKITPLGKKIARQPLHPRLAKLMITCGGDGADLAAIIASRDFLGRSAPVDAGLRVKALQSTRTFTQDHPYVINQAAFARVKEERKRLRPLGKQRLSLGQMAALAYPDRIGLRRQGKEPRYLLSGGSGATLPQGDPMAGDRMIVATDLDGAQTDARIRMAVAITEAEIKELYPDRIKVMPVCAWSKRDRKVIAKRQTCFGALILAQDTWADCPEGAIHMALLTGIRELGITTLPWTKDAHLLCARVEWLRAQGGDVPNYSQDGLMEGLEDWLLPYLGGIKSFADLGRLNLASILDQNLSFAQKETLNQTAPATIRAPTGTRMKVDYAFEPPKVSVRLQEVFGLGVHPTLGPKRQPVLIELLSPAGRPVQTTADLPNFWRSSYADVRKDMRGRYPKHPWPEDPLAAQATRRAKPRGT